MIPIIYEHEHVGQYQGTSAVSDLSELHPSQ